MFRFMVVAGVLSLGVSGLAAPAWSEVHICKPSRLCADFVKACAAGGGKHTVTKDGDGIDMDVCERPNTEAQMPFGTLKRPS